MTMKLNNIVLGFFGLGIFTPITLSYASDPIVVHAIEEPATPPESGKESVKECQDPEQADIEKRMRAFESRYPEEALKLYALIRTDFDNFLKKEAFKDLDEAIEDLTKRLESSQKTLDLAELKKMEADKWFQSGGAIFVGNIVFHIMWRSLKSDPKSLLTKRKVIACGVVSAASLFAFLKGVGDSSDANEEIQSQKSKIETLKKEIAKIRKQITEKEKELRHQIVARRKLQSIPAEPKKP